MFLTKNYIIETIPLIGSFCNNSSPYYYCSVFLSQLMFGLFVIFYDLIQCFCDQSHFQIQISGIPFVSQSLSKCQKHWTKSIWLTILEIQCCMFHQILVQHWLNPSRLWMMSLYHLLSVKNYIPKELILLNSFYLKK